MVRAIAIAIAVGSILGGVGGMVAGGDWLWVGGCVLVLAVFALYAVAIWKNPSGLIRAEADVEAMSSGYPPGNDPRPVPEQIVRRQPKAKVVVPSNNTPHADARAGSVVDQPPSARAGERGR
jgi:hypothetical protein